jgi:hypothetical protein
VTDAYGVEAPGADPATPARMKAFGASLMRALPRVTRVLRVPTPRQTLDQHLNGTLGTFCFHSSLPHLVCVCVCPSGLHSPTKHHPCRGSGSQVELAQLYVRGWDAPDTAYHTHRWMNLPCHSLSQQEAPRCPQR